MDSKTHELIMNNPHDYAWIGNETVKSPIRRVILSFHGLGFNTMKKLADPTELEYAANGGLCITPYYGPWSWMNDIAVELVDTIIDGVFKKFSLPAETPIISTGGSMGGLSALIFCAKSKHKVTACYANCPVCDLPFHATERPDLPRTMYAAFAHYECGLDKAMELNSPVHQVNNLPDIPYLIVHGDQDKSVNKEKHSDKLIALMRNRGMSVEYIEVPGMEHVAINDYAVYRCTVDFVKSFGV